jgi:hypothetical protein
LNERLCRRIWSNVRGGIESGAGHGMLPTAIWLPV